MRERLVGPRTGRPGRHSLRSTEDAAVVNANRDLPCAVVLEHGGLRRARAANLQREVSMRNQANGRKRTMRAWAIDAYGGPDEMRMRELPIPQRGPRDVLIRMHGAEVGVWDDLV